MAFELRPEAKFSDGTPVTAEDVAWTYRTLLEKGRPSFRIQMADVKDVVVESPRRVVFHFKSNENRELPLILGGLPVLPKHFFDGRDFTRPLTDPPIGSGPYRIADFELGRSVTYARRPDWWAADMPTGKGTNNFDRVRIEYFRDSTVAMEAFKAGQIDLRSENISKNWATAYDFPAVAARAGDQARLHAPPADRHAGLRDEHAPSGVRQSAGAPGDGRGVRLRVGEQEPVLRQLHPHARATSATATSPRPASRRATS